MAHGISVKNKFDEVLFSDDKHVGIKRVAYGYTKVQYYDSSTDITHNEHEILLPAGLTKANALIFARPDTNPPGAGTWESRLNDHPEAQEKYRYEVPWNYDGIDRASLGYWPLGVTFNDRSNTFSIIAPDNSVDYYQETSGSTNEPFLDGPRLFKNSMETYGANGEDDSAAAAQAYYEIWVSGVDPNFEPTVQSFSLGVGSTTANMYGTVASFTDSGMTQWGQGLYLRDVEVLGFRSPDSGVPSTMQVGGEESGEPYYGIVTSSGSVGIDRISAEDFGYENTPAAGGIGAESRWPVWNFAGSTRIYNSTNPPYQYNDPQTGFITQFTDALSINREITDCWWCDSTGYPEYGNQFDDDVDGFFCFGVKGDVGSNDPEDTSIFASLLVADVLFVRSEGKRTYNSNRNVTVWYWDITHGTFEAMKAAAPALFRCLVNLEGFVDYSNLTAEERITSDPVGFKVNRPTVFLDKDLEIFDSTSEFFKIEQVGYNHLGPKSSTQTAISRPTSLYRPSVNYEHIVPFRMYLENKSNVSQLEYMALLNGSASAVGIVHGGGPLSNGSHEIPGRGLTGTSQEDKTAYWRAFVEFHYYDENDVYYRQPSIIQVPRLAYTKWPFGNLTGGVTFYWHRFLIEEQRKYRDFVRFNDQVGVKTLSIIGKTV